MSIIKRRKTAHYTQIHNNAIQNDLKDLAAIGLLSYIISLPEDWVLYKTHLQKEFSRRKVDSAWNILVEKGYIIGFYGWLGGKKTYLYMASDIPFTKTEFDSFVSENITEMETDDSKFHHPTSIKFSPFSLENTHESDDEHEQSKGSKSKKKPTVQNVQFKGDSSERTNTNKTKTNETKTNINKLSIVNYQEPAQNYVDEIENMVETKIQAEEFVKDDKEGIKLLTNAANEYYTEFAIGRWNKKEWKSLITQFVTETILKKRHLKIPYGKIQSYVYVALKKIVEHHDYKNSEEYKNYTKIIQNSTITQKELPNGMYNWLDVRE